MEASYLVQLLLTAALLLCGIYFSYLLLGSSEDDTLLLSVAHCYL